MTGEGARQRVHTLLGPAFVAAIAYVDPGNVGANLSAGATYGYQLVWVLVLASAAAALIQYQSAKLGLVTGHSLTSLVRAWIARRGPTSHLWAWGYGAQAFVIAIATDLAEVVGGALALYLLFGTPLWLGGVIVALVSVLLLKLLRRHSARTFELAIGAFLMVIVIGFIGSLWFAPPAWDQVAQGLVPYVPDAEAWTLVGAMLGATVMPHAIYLHSDLAIDRHRPDGTLTQPFPHLLRAQKVDVGAALAIAGAVNISMILLAASTLQDTYGDTIEAAYQVFTTDLGHVAAIIFALGLLASGISSTIVGTHAGSQVLEELYPRSLPSMVRRVLTVGPAVVLLALNLSPTGILVGSQLVLSFGIALAMIPLALLTADRRVMGDYVDSWLMKIINAVLALVIVGLNLAAVIAIVTS